MKKRLNIIEKISAVLCSVALFMSIAPRITQVMALGEEKVLLSLDYEECKVGEPTGVVTKEGGALTENRISVEGNGNKYATFGLNWGSYIYMLNSSIPRNDAGDYRIKFDFNSSGTRTDYTIMLANSSKIVDNTDASRYHHFGLLSAGTGNGTYTQNGVSDKKFRFNDKIVDGINYEENKWYTYELIFNISTKVFSLTISERDNSLVKGSIRGTVVTDKGWGQGMMDQVYDAFKLGYNGVVRLDNILVERLYPTPECQSIKFIDYRGLEQTKPNTETKKIVCSFSEAMDEESFNSENVWIKDDEGNAINITGEFSEDNKVYTVILKSGMTANKRYSFYISENVMSIYGEKLQKRIDMTLQAEDADTLLNIDYDNYSLIPDVFYGVTPTYELKNGRTGRYMEIQPSWGNSGYTLKSHVLDDETEYTVRFDFSMKGVRNDIPAIMLCQKDKVYATNDNAYHHFGLVMPTTDGEISVAGHKVPKIKYYEDTWYSYEMTFNRRTGCIRGMIYDYENSENTGEFEFVAQEGMYGAGMPALNYDGIKFNCNGSIGIDNLFIGKSTEIPIKISVSNNCAGNIFGVNDEKILNVNMRNELGEPLNVDLAYVVLNEYGEKVALGDSVNVQIDGLGAEKYEIPLDINEFGVYDIFFDVKISDKNIYYKTKGYDFSFVNSNSVDGEVNYISGITVASSYIDTESEWEHVKEILLKAGIGAMRSDIRWSDVQPEAGKGFSEEGASYAEIAYRDSVNSGINNMAIIEMSNPLYYGGHTVPNAPHQIGTEKAWTEWEAYVDWITERYKDSVTHWEVINEPNAYVEPEIYAEYFNRAAPIIRKNDTDGKICAIASSGVDDVWIKKALTCINKEYVDVITVHPYDWAWSGQFCGLDNWSTVLRDRIYKNNIQSLRRWCDMRGFADTVIIFTEISVSSTPPTFDRKGLSSLKGQAAELVQLYAMTSAEEAVSAAYWYSLVSTSNRGYGEYIDGDRNGNFGLVGNGRDAVPYSAKPAYVAMAGANKMLAGAEFSDSVEEVISTNLERGMRMYKFSRADGKQVVVLWVENWAKDITLNLGTTDIEIYDMYTNSIGNMKSENGEYSFTASFEPIYIVGDFNDMTISEEIISVDSGFKETLRGEKVVFELEDKELRGLTVTADGTVGAVVTDIVQTEDGKWEISVMTNKEAQQEETIEVKAFDGDNLVYYGRLVILTAKVRLDAVYENETDINSVNKLTGNRVSVILSADNLYEYNSENNIMAVYYDNDKKFMELTSSNIGKISRGSNEILLNLDIPKGCSEIKFMLWSDINGLVPLCENLKV